MVVGVGCLGLGLAQRCLAAEAHLINVLLIGLVRPLQVDEEVGDYLAQHPDVLLGEAEVAENLGVRGENAIASPRGAAHALPVWDQVPADPRRDDVHKRVVVCRRASSLHHQKFVVDSTVGDLQ